MIAILTLLIVITISMIMTRVATVMLMQTGMSRDIARFQALSAFSGAGYTTNEAEMIVNHPVRRKIVIVLMILGNAGLVTAVSTLIISFVGAENITQGVERVALLLAGVVALYMIASSQWLERISRRVISWALKRITDVQIADYANLLHVRHNFSVAEFKADGSLGFVDKTLAELELTAKGIVVLGIHRRDGEYVGVPHGETMIHNGDMVVAYGDNRLLKRMSKGELLK